MDPVVITAAQATALETGGRIRRGTGRCGRASPSAPCRRAPREGLASRGFRTGSPSAACWWAQKQWSSSRSSRCLAIQASWFETARPAGRGCTRYCGGTRNTTPLGYRGDLAACRGLRYCSLAPRGDSGLGEIVKRRVVGFRQDEEGHWVAELECGHTQHVRHDPPWQVRPWVVTEEGREAHLGMELDCRLCSEEAD